MPERLERPRRLHSVWMWESRAERAGGADMSGTMEAIMPKQDSSSSPVMEALL
jgi:hypothetical protein